MDYTCTTRSSYFRVQDEQAFRDFMSHVVGEVEIKVFKDEDRLDENLFAFGTYGSITGYIGPDEDEYDVDPDDAYGAFIEGLQKHIVDGDACLIFEAGNEGLRYVNGFSTIVTRTDCKAVSLISAATAKAQEMLGNKVFSPKTCY